MSHPFVLHDKLQAPLVTDPLMTVPAHATGGRFLSTQNSRSLWIQAPLGFGKTRIMAALFHQTDSAVWLSLEPEDVEPGRLFLHLFAALEPLCIAEQVSKPHWQADSPESVLAALRPEQLKPGILFIDDVHYLKGSSHLALLQQWLRQTGLRHVCATEEFLWPLQREFLSGRALQIDASQLRWDEPQLKSCFSADVTSVIQQATQGWPLACEVLRQQNHTITDSEIRQMEQTLTAYWEPLIIPRLNARQKELLTAVALWGEVSKAWLSDTADRDLLKNLALTMPFLMETLPGEYRFGAFARDYFIRDLSVEKRQTLSEQGVAFLREQQRWQGALELAEAAPDSDFFYATLRDLSLPLLGDGHIPLLKSKLTAVPNAVLRQYPKLLMFRGVVQALMGEIVQAQSTVLLQQELHVPELQQLYLQSLLYRKQGRQRNYGTS